MSSDYDFRKMKEANIFNDSDKVEVVAARSKNNEIGINLGQTVIMVAKVA